MGKYEIIIKDIEIYRLEIEADSSHLALDKAYLRLEQDRDRYHDGSDGVYEITEISE